MTDEDEITAFCRDRIGDEERDAWAAVPGGPHSAGPVSWEARWIPGAPAAEGWQVVWAGREGRAYTEASQVSAGFSHHAARHDPPRVLRECAARRRTLERHQVIDTDSTGERPCLRCAHCIQAGVFTWPCPDVADLASTWADHPHYKKEEWAP